MSGPASQAAEPAWPFLYEIAFEIEPADEALFNRVYDTDHVPNILTVEGVTACLRYRVAPESGDGLLTYVALYFLKAPDIPETEAWRMASDRGDWARLIRPRVKSRRRRFGAVVAAHNIGT